MTGPDSTNRKTKDALPPFDAAAPDWNLVLRSSDDVDFHVDRCFLSYTSLVFKDMLASPQPHSDDDKAEGKDNGENENENWKDGRPVVRLAEEADLIRVLLGFVYPGDAPTLKGLEELTAVIEAARKYQMADVSVRARKALVAEKFLQTEPLRVFVIAYLFRFEKEARLAARRMLRHPMIGSQMTSGAYPSLTSLRQLDAAKDEKRIMAAAQKIRARAAGEGRKKFRLVKPEPAAVKELEYISAATFLRLQKYYIDCERAAQAVSESKDWLQDKTAVWLCCTACGREEEEGAKSSSIVMPAHWWVTYMQYTANAFMTAPCGETVKRTELLHEVYRQAAACKRCRDRVCSGMEDFCKLYAAEVEKAISKVVLDLQFQ